MSIEIDRTGQVTYFTGLEGKRNLDRAIDKWFFAEQHKNKNIPKGATIEWEAALKFPIKELNMPWYEE